ncbi:cysteine desulfurase-like protein [Brevibacillus sp. SYP-B805]|uniref:cysteine desulfurase-like protein n=1 Tax=Brevibacillus sp. SYP-B805 TaxID=1578199 RepID=UPI003216D8E3
MKQLHECRSDFPSLERMVAGKPAAYFDGPGGTQVPRAVIEAITHYYVTSNANAHGPFVTSRETDETVDRTRERMAAFLGAVSGETVSFGANMTSLAFSLSRAISRVIRPGDEVIVTALDHEANRGPWLRLAEHGAVVRNVRMTQDGRLDLDDLRAQLSSRTKLVAVGYSSNALGTVNDLPLIRRLSREVGAWLIVDAVHYAPHFPLDVQSLDPDFLLCSAYKFYGPHVGILYARPGLLDQLPTDKLRPQSDEAPYRIETGTLNFAALAGVAAAVEYIASYGEGDGLRRRLVDAMNRIHAHEEQLASRLYAALSSLPHVTVYGQPFGTGLRAPTLSFAVEGVQAPDAARLLGEQGFFVWGGHFYAMSVIESLGLESQGGLVRVGISMYNTEEEVDRLAEAIGRLR